MTNFFVTMAIAASASIANAKLITLGPVTDAGSDVAIVWIQGAFCDNAGYETIAAEVQAEGVAKGQRIFVGIPDFITGSPDPISLPGKVSDAVATLRDLGFTGDNIVLAGHSLGGVMAQGYTKSNSDTVKAQVLMGAVLTRDQRSINADGTSNIDYPVPTLTVGGTKDGLMRISRVSEAFWHSHINIESSQAELFPVMAFEGVSHAQFTSGSIPVTVSRKDLTPDVTETQAHKLVANAMVEYFD